MCFSFFPSSAHNVCYIYIVYNIYTIWFIYVYSCLSLFVHLRQLRVWHVLTRRADIKKQRPHVQAHNLRTVKHTETNNGDGDVLIGLRSNRKNADILIVRLMVAGGLWDTIEKGNFPFENMKWKTKKIIFILEFKYSACVVCPLIFAFHSTYCKSVCPEWRIFVSSSKSMWQTARPKQKLIGSRCLSHMRKKMCVSVCWINTQLTIKMMHSIKMMLCQTVNPLGTLGKKHLVDSF